ncbi:transposase [Streptomyces sp. NPDC059378]|uniref:transposase n=1 Tax=Streptomyces sp. NPDC059378 TaxID=3346815 RepID=UPI0036AD1406
MRIVVGAVNRIRSMPRMRRRAVLSGRACARAKAGDGSVQIGRMYKLTKASAVKARTQAINQLKAVLVTADPVLREELAGLGNAELFRICAQFTDARGREEVGAESVVQATRITLGQLAHRIGQLSEEIRDVEARLTRLVERHAPQVLDVVGIGPDTAVTLLITVGGNPERLDSEASFAALCGVSPVERSSGRRQYRRLNRGGDRQANAALHRIVFTRLRVDPRTGTTTSAASRRARPDAKSSKVRLQGQRFRVIAHDANPVDWIWTATRCSSRRARASTCSCKAVRPAVPSCRRSPTAQGQPATSSRRPPWPPW